MNANDQRLAIEQLQKGIVQHRAGQLSLAQSHYQRAAKLDPSNPNTWHMLGVCALQSDNLALAAKHLRTCIKTSPGFAEAHNNLGVALRRMGKHAESVTAFRGALGARDRYVEASYNLALAHESLGNPGGAERSYRLALQWRPNDPKAANNLGNLLRRHGRFADALPLLELVRNLQPDSAQANGNLALVLIDLGRFQDAALYAHAAAVLEPTQPQWWRVLGVAERLRRNTEPAIAALRRAVELAPDDEIALSELGMTLAEAGAVEESREILSRVKSNERHAERIRWALALSLSSIYRDEAEVDAERARFSRGLDEIAANLKLETPPQRLSAYDAACGVAPFLLHYQDRNNTELQYSFGDLITRVMSAAAPNFMQPCAWRARAHGGRVRVGIVSSHLMQHTVSRYFRTMLGGLDPTRFDVRVWYGGELRDVSTHFIESRVAAFEHVNEEVLATAAKIRAAELDVLIYPETGMDPRHQALAALRLAPVQCVLYGHPATSGLANLDYFLSGEVLEPANAQTHYREKLLLLPGLGADPLPPPLPGDGSWIDEYAQNAPLLLCLQNHLKLMPAFDATLATLAAKTRARIGFFQRGSLIGQRFRARIENVFSQHGLDPQTALAFLPAQTYETYLGAVARAPLVLDSPWFSGGATSLDALSVGTPVLTLQGTMARGRQTAGMLRILGIDELITTSDEDYVETAAALLGDAQRRANLREQILKRKSALFENNSVIAAFADFIEQAAASAPS